MRVFFLVDDFYSDDSPVWLNIFWPQYNAMRQSFDTVLLAKPNIANTRHQFFRRPVDWRQRWQTAADLRDQVIKNLDPHGPNILFAVALNNRDLRWSSVFHPIWSAFDYRVLSINDTLQPDSRSHSLVSRFDIITSVCEDLAKEYRSKFDIPVLYWPPHTDVLNFHCTSDYRPIDLITVGRREHGKHAAFNQHFGRPGGKRLFLDFVTRTATKIYGEDEFNVLFGAYGRSSCSLCFEPSYLARFEGRSPLTSRWVHAWAAGCTILGKAPFGSGVEEQMNWPGSVIDLPDGRGEAITFVEGILDDTDGLKRRRFENVRQALLRHDTRLRIRDMLTDLNLDIPDTLSAELNRIDDLVLNLTELENAGLRD